MLPIFAGTFIFGSILIGVSLVFGGGDHDFDTEGDFDVDVDVDGDIDVDVDQGSALMDGIHDIAVDTADASEVWLPFLSMRFWTFFAAFFGLSGLLLDIMTGSSTIATVVAVVVGGTVGTGAAYLFRFLKRDRVSGEVGLKRFVGVEGRVLLPIRPSGGGKIVIETLADRVELPARSRDSKVLGVGSAVLIAHIHKDGVADVTSIPVGGSSVVSNQTETDG